MLRDEAKLADKKWKRFENKWWWVWERSLSQGGLSQEDAKWYLEEGNRLENIADQLWAEADKKSMELGIPYQRRDKSIWTPDGLPRLGNFERALQTLLARIDEGRITWPPAQ